MEAHSLRLMLDETGEIIRKLEAARDECIRRYNGAIELLRGGGGASNLPEDHRFQPKVAVRPSRNRPSAPKPAGRAKGVKKPTAAPSARDAKSVKDVIREAVRSQTQPFTLGNVKDYVQTRYPAIAATISSDRYSKELYHLRTSEHEFEISSRGEKGGAHIYKRRAA